jgi:hypothetical protein
MSEAELIKMPVDLISQAIEKGAGVDALEKLMQLQAQWEAKEAAKAFKSAMVDFQSKKPKLVKTEKAHNSKYNPLPKIQEAIDGVLSECGLTYRWEQDEVDGRIKITCVVSHVMGHSERTFITAPADTSGAKNSIQAIGSTVSYLKRYTLEGALGLSSDKDDDGGKPKEKPELFPTHPRWKSAVAAYKQGKESAVKDVYTVSEVNDALLRKEAGV